MRKVLFIGMVWPEPSSSAAGTRIVQLVNFFLKGGDEVHFASAAAWGTHSYDLKSLKVHVHGIKLNDSGFDQWINELNPTIVIYDRFPIEEQYGWRVKQQCPTALTILDTEDLHFVRQARQLALKANRTMSESDLDNEITKRELAAILRCDLSLIISEIEMDILKQFNINESILCYLPFLEEEIADTQVASWQKFDERKDFVFIGNYLHEPNWQTLRYLKTEVWPLLRKKVPEASLHCYGAYASEKVMQLNKTGEKFFVHGRAENARQTISNYRVLLAPLRFGAGVKGKFIDAMHSGTPIASSVVGAEGMNGNLDWPGIIEDDLNSFINQTVKLYTDPILWIQAQKNGIKVLNERYAGSKFETHFANQMATLLEGLPEHRRKNYLGQILHHHSLQSTKYLSLWIEEKNKE